MSEIMAAAEIVLPSDPHIQAFTILSDRVSNLEDDVGTIKQFIKSYGRRAD